MKRLPRYLSGLSALVRYRRQRPDIAWVQYTNLPDLAFVFVARLLGMTVMVTPHLGSNWKSQANPLLRWTSAFLLSFADRLALISKTQELEIALPGGVPRSLIRNFLPVSILTGPLPDEGGERPLQLIHSARLSADKGTFKVVEVGARLRDAGVAFVTRITGGADPETYAQLDALIAEHKLADQVKVLGRIPEDELLDHLRGADVLIHLSRIDSYPLIVLEALANTTLPIAMELAGARDMIEQYDGHVVSRDGAVAETADWLIAASPTDLRARGRAQADAVRTDYAWPRCADALDRALRACIAGDPAPTEPERTR